MVWVWNTLINGKWISLDYDYSQLIDLFSFRASTTVVDSHDHSRSILSFFGMLLILAKVRFSARLHKNLACIYRLKRDANDINMVSS